MIMADPVLVTEWSYKKTKYRAVAIMKAVGGTAEPQIARIVVEVCEADALGGDAWRETEELDNHGWAARLFRQMLSDKENEERTTP